MTALTLNTPLPVRLRAWVAERFPLANSVLALAVYLAALLTGRALTTDGALTLTPADAAGFLGAWGFFLMLRVFDEHKDYDLDGSNHPDRVLQRGLVTLGHLKLVGAVAIALQLAAVLIVGAGAWLWAATLAWSLLMLKEFFLGEWLERHFVLYAGSHLLAMPLALLWIAQMGAGEQALPAEAAWLAAAGFLLGAALEIARKVRAPRDEQLGVMTYTKRLGITGSALAVAVCTGGCFVAIAALLVVLGVATVITLGVLAVALAAALAATEAFAVRPSRTAAARVEIACGVAVLVALLTLVLALIADRGL